jgi:polyhydroxybutyrate depolymerase
MRTITAGFFLLLGTMTHAQPTRTPGRHSIELEHGSHVRTAEVHVPALAVAIPKPPLVIVLHGAGGSGEGYLDNNGWAVLAEEEGVIVAAPDGLPAAPEKRPNFAFNPALWNSGQLKTGSERSTIDDVGFLTELLDSLIAWYDIDTSRVFVTGHSNGAGMTFQFAADRSERITAIAAVAGHCWMEDPRPLRPMPSIFIVGDKDPLIPFEGGEVRLPWGRKQKNPPVRVTLDRWAKGLGCLSAVVERDSTSQVRILDFGTGTGNGSLAAYVIRGQGHGWPGGKEAGLPERMIGPKTKHLDATKLIWKFFNSVSVK